MIRFESIWGQLILVKYARHAKTSNFVKNFGSDMVRFGSFWVSGLLSSEHISGVGSGMDMDRSVWISGQFYQV